MTDKALVRVTPEKLKELRESVKETLEVDADSYDARDIRRFNEGDWYPSLFLQWKETIPEVVQLVKNVFKWRKDNKINDLSIDGIGEEHFKRGLIYTNGYDKDGKRLVYMKCQLHNKKLQTEHKMVLWYWLERFQRAEPGKKITFVMDVPGASLSNNDMEFSKIIIATFTENYPGLLSRFLIFDMPWIFNKIWQIIKLFLNDQQKEHVILCTKKDVGEYVDQDNLLIRMGGKNEFEYSYPPFPDNLN